MQISVIFILPETKGITLERMDKLFGQIDNVLAGEQAIDKEINTSAPGALEREKEEMVKQIEYSSKEL